MSAEIDDFCLGDQGRQGKAARFKEAARMGHKGPTTQRQAKYGSSGNVERQKPSFGAAPDQVTSPFRKTRRGNRAGVQVKQQHAMRPGSVRGRNSMPGGDSTSAVGAGAMQMGSECGVLLRGLLSLVEQQTAALASLSQSLSQLVQTVQKGSHIRQRVSARQQQFSPPVKDETELGALRFKAKVKLQEIVQARESQKLEPKAKPSLYAAQDAAKASLKFKEDTDHLKKTMDSLLDGAIDNMAQYDRCSNRRSECQTLNHLIDKYNNQNTYDFVWATSHAVSTFYQDGTVSSISYKFVDPGIFWTKELQFKPRPKASCFEGVC